MLLLSLHSGIDDFVLALRCEFPDSYQDSHWNFWQLKVLVDQSLFAEFQEFSDKAER
jgi:hypothetical protein